MAGQTSKDLQYYKRRVVQFHALIEATTLINSSLELEEVLRLILESTKQLLSADSCSILLMSDKTEELSFHVALGAAGQELMKMDNALKKGEGIAGWVAETGVSVVIDDAYECPHFCRTYDVLTGYKTKSMICIPLRVKGKTIGVAQVINKLAGGTFTEEDRELFENLGTYAAIAIENAKLHRSLLENERVERDLKLARKVQQGFLPKTMPEIKSFKIDVHYVPALYVSGDFYHFIPLENGRIAFVFGDVSGKGVPAALLMARLLSEVRFMSVSYGTPADTMYCINNAVCDEVQAGMFATLIYGVLDPESASVELILAGHPSPIIWDKKRQAFIELHCKSGLPVGIIKNVHYQVCNIDMKDKCMLLYTDGVTEARDKEGNEFGLDRFLDIVSEQFSKEGFTAQVTQPIYEFLQGGRQHDDITLVYIEHTGDHGRRTP